MKKVALIMGVFALAGCGAAEAPAEDTAAVEAEATYADGAGVYTRTYANDEGVTDVTVTTITADGTFTSATNGVETNTGTAAFDGDTVCFDWEANEGEAECWVNEPMNESGSFKTTAPNGKKYTLQMTPLAAE